LSSSSPQALKQEFERFIEFGTLLDRPSRTYLVEYFRYKLEGIAYQEAEINNQYFVYFRDALDQIFQLEGLLEICANNEHITLQVVRDILYWMRQIASKVEAKHPHTSEMDRLSGWAVTPLKVFRGRHPYLINFLRQNYHPAQLDTGFYLDHFKRFFAVPDAEQEQEAREKFELIFKDLLSQWDALLQAKILAYQLRHLKEEQEKYNDLLENKVNEYQKLNSLVSPFSEYLAWDMSRELWQKTSFNILEKYSELLQKEDSIRALVDQLGKLREAEVEMEEETISKTIIRQEWKVDEDSKAEIVGIHESKDLNNLLSSEVGLLSHPATESLFLKKYADSNLLTFRYEDQKLVTSTENEIEVHYRVRQKEKGPFIICVDTSQSMEGPAEQIAKVLCMGILKMAITENRRAYLINFSIGIQTMDLYDIANSIDGVAEFLSMSFYGGTDASPALYEAISQLKANDYQDADVLMVSDFIMYRIDQNVLREVKYFQQNKGTEFHSLTLSTEANSEILSNFDTNWIYDPEEKGIIRELTRGLHSIGKPD